MSSATRQSTSVDFVEEYAAAAERFGVAVAWADLRAPVPSCPGWTAYDLVVHLGNVHAWAATIVETGRSAAEHNDEPVSAKPRTVSAWYAGKAEDLYEVLRSADPDAPCWNFAFAGGRTSFWRRRQLHETAIHQVDLDQTLGRSTELAPVVCADGVDEVLQVFLPRMHRRGRLMSPDRPVALTATDTGDTWVVSPQPGPTSAPVVPAQPAGRHADRVQPPPTVERRRTRPLTAVHDVVEAPAEVLYRLLWKRVDPDAEGVRLAGDEDRLRAFLGSALVP